MVEEFYYLVKIKTRPSSNEVYFVCTKNRRDELSLPSTFHGVGFWHTSNEYDGLYDNIEEREEEEVWIPYSNIAYIKSLMYRSR